MSISLSLCALLLTVCLSTSPVQWAHRALHLPAIYGYVHKVHHQYKTSIGIASEYAHPVEFIFSNGAQQQHRREGKRGVERVGVVWGAEANKICSSVSFSRCVLSRTVIPFTAGPLLFGCHYWTLWQWMILRVGETVEGHSGYEFAFSPFRLLPMSGSSTGHDFHHSHNVGNFGSFFSYWDRLCGTDRAFAKWEAKQAAIRQGQQAAQAKLVAAGKVAVKDE